MATKQLAASALDAATLRKALDYDPKTGVLTWRWRDDVPRRTNNRFAGKPAGGSDGQYGYISVRLYDRLYQAHRLAWLWMTGEWPTHLIDHIDMDPKNNAWDNLRPATKSQNMMNQGKPRHNKSGFKGVFGAAGCWTAQIQVNRKNHILGTFDTAEEAHAAYCAAAARLHGAFARTE